MTQEHREYLERLRKTLEEAKAEVFKMKLNALDSGVMPLGDGLEKAKTALDQILGSK